MREIHLFYLSFYLLLLYYITVFRNLSLAMVNAKKTSFTATQVANNGMAMGAAFMRILELEKEVSRLRHHVSVLSKRLNGKEKREEETEKEEVAEVVAEAEAEAEEGVEAGAAAVGTPPITSGVYKVVAEKEVVASEVVAGIEAMSMGSEVDEDEVVNGKIVVRLPGDRKRRIAEAGGGDRVEEKALVRAIPVGPRSGVMSMRIGEGVPREPSGMFGRGRGGTGRGFGFGMEGYGYRSRGRGRGGYSYGTNYFR